MKKRQRRGVVFICERHLRERECRWPGEFAVAVLGQHFLQIGTSIRIAMEVSITFAKREISIRPASASRVVVEILLIFRDRQVVQFASEQAVGVVELTLIRPFSFARRMVPKRRLLTSGELCRLIRPRAPRVEQAVHLPDEPDALPAPIER